MRGAVVAFLGRILGPAEPRARHCWGQAGDFWGDGRWKIPYAHGGYYATKMRAAQMRGVIHDGARCARINEINE